MNKNLLRKLEALRDSPHGLVNQYKRRDVFRCIHDAHLHFHNAVSVYHVLKEKRCFPEGCLYFRWKCRKLGKGDACPRKYNHVGRSCASCRYFYDEKEISQRSGTVVLTGMRMVDILARGEACFWTVGRARVAQQTGTVLPRQDEGCYRCDKGSLITITQHSKSRRGPRRKMFCFEGVPDPALCCYQLPDADNAEPSDETCPSSGAESRA